MAGLDVGSVSRLYPVPFQRRWLFLRADGGGGRTVDLARSAEPREVTWLRDDPWFVNGAMTRGVMGRLEESAGRAGESLPALAICSVWPTFEDAGPRA
jgi:hypothetical protein